MDLRMNAGYIITDSIHVGDTEFVLGVSSTTPSQFVTWECRAGSDYFWGHYFSDRIAATRNLLERAGAEFEIQEIQREKAREAHAKENGYPAYTPWGEIDRCTDIAPGVFSVSTSSHGGIMVDTDMVRSALSAKAQELGFQYGGFLCYEEDCDAPIVLRELMDKKLYTAPVNEYYKEGEYSALIDDSLRHYHPDYWLWRETQLSKPEKSAPTKLKNGKERER